MPNPREAIFDVLKAKHRRSVDQRLAERRASSPDPEWTAYLEANERAREAYDTRRK